MTGSLTCESVARAGLGKPVKREGTELLWRCPNPVAHTHGDSHPSLKINPKKDVFMCAPCGAQGRAWALAAFLAGVTASDKQAVKSWLEPRGLLNSAEREREPQAKCYDYRDADGQLIYQVCRAPGEKKIWQRRPDGKGGWIRNLDGVERVLYNLPAVLSADVVCIAEGEKDCDTLAASHLERYSLFVGRTVAATTNSGGAGKWNPADGKHCAGKDVLVFEDNDDVGHAHALDVLRSVRQRAKSVKLIRLPGVKPKGDVSDWMQDHSMNDLLAEIQRAPLWQPEPNGITASSSLASPPGADATTTVSETPAPELPPATGAEILGWIVSFLKRFVSLNTEQACGVALWVAHTHAMSAADCTPYLAINSAERQSGKTRLLEVLRLLVPVAWYTGRATAAVLVRKIDAVSPTLLLDESDAAFNGDPTYAEALRGVLNSGYRRGGCASLCIGQGANLSYQDFSTFCPKAIAGIGKLPDTVADRSVPIRLKRARRGTMERFRERDAAWEAREHQAKIAAWCAAHLGDLRNARPDISSALSDRQADVCEPLLAIADAAGGEWPGTARMALLKLCVGAQADDDSVGVRLLRDIKSLFAQKDANELASAALCEALISIETSPWADWNKGKPLSQAKLARLLKPFEIYPGPLSSGQARGYRLSQFQEPFSLYIPVESAKPSETQYRCGAAADSKVSKETLSDTLENTASPSNGAGSRQFDTLKSGTGEDEEFPLDEAIFTNPAKPTPRKAGYTEVVL